MSDWAFSSRALHSLTGALAWSSWALASLSWARSPPRQTRASIKCMFQSLEGSQTEEPREAKRRGRRGVEGNGKGGQETPAGGGLCLTSSDGLIPYRALPQTRAALGRCLRGCGRNATRLPPPCGPATPRGAPPVGWPALGYPLSCPATASVSADTSSRQPLEGARINSVRRCRPIAAHGPGPHVSRRRRTSSGPARNKRNRRARNVATARWEFADIEHMPGGARTEPTLTFGQFGKAIEAPVALGIRSQSTPHHGA
jgi:hypothetical protein